MIIGYSTNGLAFHDPMEALQLLADTGYKSVAITIDHCWLHPKNEERFEQLKTIKQFLDKNEIRSVVEAGASYALDPYRKHWPNLLDGTDANSDRRIEFLKYCIDTAVFLESDCVSLTSGYKPADHSFQQSLDRLAENLRRVLAYAEEQKVDIGFEHEPGMLIDTTGRFERLIHLVESSRLKMTLNIGHLFCLSEVPLVEFIERWQDRIVNIHIADMCAGVHDPLMFGDGQIYFPPVIESLIEIGYEGAMHVELYRHNHNAAETVRESFKFLNPIVTDAKSAL